MHEDVRFKANGVELAGCLLRPAGPGPYPLVVLGHGFSATLDMGLLDYAQVFQAAGLACLAYEHRNFGASGGEPRGEIDPWQQVADLRDAISYARTLADIDPGRIGVWGTSYAGGHALVVAALDRRVRCVVAQVPLVDGPATLRSWIGDSHWAAMQQRFNEDRDARYRGQAPRTTKPARPGDQTWDWVLAIGAETTYPNLVTQRSLELIASYEPAAFVPRIAPTPLLLILATGDTQTPYAGQLAAYASAGEPKRLVCLDGGHYDPYTTSFADAAGAARDWFVTHLDAQNTP